MQFNPWWIVASLGLMFLNACTNQDYTRPAIQVDSKWDVQDDFTKRTNSRLAYLQWWTNFNDPVLNTLMVEGLKCNQQILSSKSRIEAALGEVKKVKKLGKSGLVFLSGGSR